MIFWKAGNLQLITLDDTGKSVSDIGIIMQYILIVNDKISFMAIKRFVVDEYCAITTCEQHNLKERSVRMRGSVDYLGRFGTVVKDIEQMRRDRR